MADNWQNELTSEEIQEIVNDARQQLNIDLDKQIKKDFLDQLGIEVTDEDLRRSRNV
jgi:hypothetical protein